jgi:hypothetical protein
VLRRGVFYLPRTTPPRAPSSHRLLGSLAASVAIFGRAKPPSPADDSRREPSVVKGLEKSPCVKKHRHTLFWRRGDESPKSKGGGAVKDGGVEGHPFCTSEARARKIGEEAAPSPAGFSLDGAGGFPPKAENAFSAEGVNLRPLAPQHHAGERGSHRLSGTTAERRPKARGRHVRGAVLAEYKRESTVFLERNKLAWRKSTTHQTANNPPSKGGRNVPAQRPGY